MNTLEAAHSVGQAIEAAIAPVFLIVGIASLLNMLSARLGRVIDRKRFVDAEILRAGESPAAYLLYERTRLRRRIALANWSIRSCVSSAFVVCLLVVTLFVDDFLGADLGALVAGLFVTAMLLIIAGLGLLLAEVGLASRLASESSGHRGPE